ncbi:MAG: hypothetical protein NUV67_04050 [archaeon]|nr:hypothetical protein [archaeon]
MKAVFEVKTIQADWAPPFKKNITVNTYEVKLHEEFDRITGNGNDESVFRALQIENDGAKLEFSPLFTLKDPQEEDRGEKVLYARKGTQKTIAYLWGEKGITKNIVFKGITEPFSSREEPAKEEMPQVELATEREPGTLF